MGEGRLSVDGKPPLGSENELLWPAYEQANWRKGLAAPAGGVSRETTVREGRAADARASLRNDGPLWQRIMEGRSSFGPQAGANQLRGRPASCCRQRCEASVLKRLPARETSNHGEGGSSPDQRAGTGGRLRCLEWRVYCRVTAVEGQRKPYIKLK
ncbi:hypothetical protein EJ06DRAFT_84062 [Trichodelitschia bisporula]|uniref:Uncharacterized protein n=1 Tax=Trichodelitschia bisporula TaxID=703511 RepID=A0A6G1HRM9_9PEZI|nr:hypothetical protein EJ06DRAFT_84062 [Trichodelitschia bisporula]